MIIAATVLLVSGCSGGDPEPKASPAEKVDVVSGNPLSQYEGRPSYDWRVRLVETHEEAGEALTGVADFLGHDDLDQVIATCDAIERGINGQQLVDETVTRFTGGPGEQVDPSQGQALVDLSQKYACPA